MDSVMPALDEFLRKVKNPGKKKRSNSFQKLQISNKTFIKQWATLYNINL